MFVITLSDPVGALGLAIAGLREQANIDFFSNPKIIERHRKGAATIDV
jgi:hypothetical protein